ncbi:MAG: hypothetical protein VR69_16650 [Peptococcaceae bacterium BRH_c4b]|nr:MAG: hypothetical protein VR69_16650 [Peptococcaceae bacterium BRH_c4b]
MAEKGKYIPAGIDVGNSSIVAAIAHDYGSCIPAAIASCPTIGMRRGDITDPDGLANCIGEALEKAERAAGLKVSAVRVGFTGYTAELNPVSARFTSGSARRVNQSDLDRLQRLVAIEDIPSGRQILKVIPFEYTVDSACVVKTPLGMKFKSLELTAGLLTVDSKLIDLLTGVLQRLSLQPRSFIPSTLAAAGEVLKSTEMQLGTALVDLGAVSTGVAVYNYGTQLGFRLLPVGGEHITGDLAVGMRTTLEAAGQIKIQAGLGTTDHDTFEVPGISNTGTHEIKCQFAREIIEARVCEVLDLVRAAVESMAADLVLPGGLVLTGGGAALKGLDEYAAEYLGMPVRIASSRTPGMTDKSAEDCSCTAAVGLLQNYGKDEFRTYNKGRRGMWKSLIKFFEATRQK